MEILSTRFGICLLLMLGIMASLTMRAHLSMSIVCMVKYPVNTLGLISDRRLEEECPVEDDLSLLLGAPKSSGDLEWPTKMIPHLFSASFAGTFFTLIAFGGIADKMSPKTILLLVVLSQVLLTVISPLLADFSYWSFLVARFFIGMGEGLMFSPVNAIAGRWFPPAEMASMVALYTSAYQLAFGVAPFVVSGLCSPSSIGDWRPAFYIIGAYGLFWCVAWYFVATDDPTSNRFVSSDERSFLDLTLPVRAKASERQPVAAYGRMLRSPVLLVHMFCMMAFSFIMGIASAFFPTFLKEHMRLPLQKNGFFTMAPFIAQIISKNILGLVLYRLQHTGKMSHTTSAKIGQSIGAFLSALGLYGVAFFADCTRPYITLSFLLLYGAAFTCCIVGFYTSMLHLCPLLNGRITAFVTAAGCVGSVSGTLTFGLVNTLELKAKYTIIFTIAATFQVLAGVLYLIYGTAERQPWLVEQSPEEADVPLNTKTDLIFTPVIEVVDSDGRGKVVEVN